jgi:hypothetical protein
MVSPHDIGGVCLGKLPARPGAVSFMFHHYVDPNKMPPPPASFGHEVLINKQWGMLGNDVAGDCAFAGASHESMLWNLEAGARVPFTDESVLKDYGTLTGYDPATGDNDNGTNVDELCSFRRTTGLTAADGSIHKIGAYLALRISTTELKYAIRYFDGVGIGVQFPQQWMDIFQSGGRTWPALRSPNYVGGHYVTAVAWRNNNPVIVTWGEEVELELAGFKQNADEVYAYLSLEKLVKGVDLEGLDLTKLRKDLAQLRSV